MVDKEMVRKMFLEDGLSYRKVGAALGVTSNVIAGICSRNGWRRAPIVDNGDISPSQPSPVTQKMIKVRPQPVVRKERIPKHGVRFINLREYHCRYIIGRNEGLATYCGSPKIAGSPYCHQHYLICHQRPR